MTLASIPNRPLGTDPRSIEMILADFDALIGTINGGLDSSNLSPSGQQSTMLPGDLVVSAATARAGCLLCDGSPVNRGTYAALFGAIGTTYGAGDGSSTFNLPDCRGRTLVGAGTGTGLTARALGAKVGEENHVLATAEMPSHNHGGATGGGTSGTDSPDHSHYDSGHAHGQTPGMSSWVVSTPSGSPPGRLQYTGSGGLPIDSGYATAGASASLGGASARHSHSVPALSIGAQGGGAGHNVMQPSIAVNVFIKY